MKIALLLLSALAVLGCASGPELLVVPVSPGEETPGVFTVIFAGRHYFEEVDAVLVLDLEGDEYTFVPEARKKDFEVLKSISVAEAYYEAGPFFLLHEAFSGKTRLRRIQNPEGRTIGYELRPLYDPEYFGEADMVRTSYRLSPDKKVYFKTGSKPRLTP